MTCSNIYDLRKIPIYYENLKSKKLFTRALSEIDVNKRKIHLLYYKKSNLPICAIPTLNIIIISKKNFLSFCYSFYYFISSFTTIDIPISPNNIYLIGKFALCHEIGHLLDEDLQRLRASSNEIILSVAKDIIKYNIDLKNPRIYNKNLPLEIEEAMLRFKKNIIKRELNAWNIGFEIANIDNLDEKYLFEKMKEYSLATYNLTSFESFVSENEIKKHLKEV